MKSIIKDIENICWTPHKFADEVEVKYLITQKEEDVDITCMLVHIPRGKEIPEHVHEIQADILFPLKGLGTVWIEGLGDRILKPGSSVCISPRTKHKIYDVREDLLVHDVFCPALT
jgi:quercetin dioxygenase-like cupin family protein